MDSNIVKNEIFPLVINRIKARKDSLVNMRKFLRTGIEGWFKVEAVTALANTKHAVEKLRNKGSDLTLKSGIDIELKSATDFAISGIRKEMIKHGTYLLFLQDGSDKSRIEKLQCYEDVEVICHETFSDGANDWIIGLIKPK